MITFTYKDTALLTQKKLQSLLKQKKLVDYTTFLQKEFQKKYETDYASLYTSFDAPMIEHIKKVAAQKIALNPKIVVVVAIGGSCLGAKAIQEAVLGRYYNTHDPSIKIYFVQTVDSERMNAIMCVIKKELENKRPVIINVVTKSGTTTETIANFQVLLALLKVYYPKSYHQFVVVSTNKNSPLYVSAKKHKFDVLTIPTLVGGRYSVFTAVGLFPLLMVGIDVDQLLAGAQQAVHEGLHQELDQNNCLKAALINYHHYTHGLTIHDLFLFAVDLEGVGKWYRQLVGESLGKQHSLDGTEVRVGITPTVSLGSVDLHSVAQLYLGGPRDKFTTFVTIETTKTEHIVPHCNLFENDYLSGHSFATIMNAIVAGTKKAYCKEKMPFCSFVLSKNKEYDIGYFLQFKMIETMFLAYFLHINAFDQPNVELYKKETHKILQNNYQ